MSARALFLAFFEFAAWLVTQDLHKSHNGMIFSNKARLLLDFSRVFQNASPCEIMWTIKQSLFIYLSGYVKHDVTQEVKTLDVSTNDARRDFQDRLFSSCSNITELIFVRSYTSY